MRSHHLWLSASTVLILFASCKKEEVGSTPIPPDPNTAYSIADFSDFGVGSYWVYAKTFYDSLGNYMSGPSYDSLFVSGDSTVNGNLYKVFRQGGAGSQFTQVRSLRRDSADCLVDVSGKILLRYGTFDQVAYTDYQPSVISVEYTLASSAVTESVPAGTFSCYDWHVTQVDILIPGLTPVPPSRYPYYRWSPGVGKVKQRETFSLSGALVTSELVRYNVQ